MQKSKNILDELGLSDLPEEKQGELLSSMTEVLIKRILVEVLKKLPEKDLMEFDQIRESNDAAKITEFLRSKIKDYDKLVEQIVSDFKNDIKNGLQNA